MVLSLAMMVSGSNVCAPEGSSAPDGGAVSTPASQLPSAALQSIVTQLAATSGAPGAVLAVSRAGEEWSGAAGFQDRERSQPMRADVRFRAGSITKMLTGVVIMQLVEQEKLSLDAKLAEWFPDFPHAHEITIDMLLAHTAGVSTRWLDEPAIQIRLAQDMTHTFTSEELLQLAHALAPAGAPGDVGLAYSNAGFVLLGEIAARITGSSLGELFQQRIFEPCALEHTSYQFDDLPGLTSGYFDFAGMPLDAASLPPQAILSLAGAAGALHSTATDLLRFQHKLFEGTALLSETSLAHMKVEGEKGGTFLGAGYGRALMALCPCEETADGRSYAAYGHGGNMPGYWSLASYFPAKQLAVSVMINATAHDGEAIDRSALDAAAQAVFEAVE
jgi:D-alanyl-D-alanine carboxypeptidase